MRRHNVPRLAGVLLAGLLFTSCTASQLSTASSPALVQLPGALGRPPAPLALSFVENRGQLDSRVAYAVLGRAASLYFTRSGVTLALTPSGGGSPLQDPAPGRWAVAVDFVDAQPGSSPQGQERASATASYYRGEPQHWTQGVPIFGAVHYENLWPGVGLTYSGSDGRLKYTFVVEPGVDPAVIRLAYRGASSIDLDASGRLQVTTPLGSFTEEPPYVYQDIDGRRVQIAATYVLEPQIGPPGAGLRSGSAATEPSLHEVAIRDYTVTFDLGSVDPAWPLVIDPVVLLYAGFLGGTGQDDGTGIGVDAAGNAYVTGTTASSEASFPEAVGPDLTYNGGTDVFVAKIRADGSGLAYAGYLGGDSIDAANAIAVDAAGNAYVAGTTFSANFPTTPGAYQRLCTPYLTLTSCSIDVFVSKVDPGGTLLWSTFFGGNDIESVGGIAVDAQGSAYVSGYTWSTNFPTVGAYQSTLVGPANLVSDYFLTKLKPDGSDLLYSTLLGGALGQEAHPVTLNPSAARVAVDNAGFAYLVGSTDSADFPTTPNTYQPVMLGSASLFVAKFNPGAFGPASLVASTFVGGAGGGGVPLAVAVDGAGHPYIAGQTGTSDFPTTAGAQQRRNAGQVLFKSADGAGNWGSSTVGVGLEAVTGSLQVVISPQSPATLYAAGRGVFKSTDGGGTWGEFNMGLPVNPFVAGVIIDPQTPTTLYASLGSLQTGGGIYKTTNGGAVWAPVNAGLPSDGFSNSALALDPQNPTTIYATIAPSGVYATTNGGASWTLMSSVSALANAQALAVNPQAATVLLAASFDGVYRSANAGATWTKLGGGLPGGSFNGVVFDPATSTTAYALMSGRAFKTTNGGDNWTELAGGLPTVESVRLRLAIHPLTPATLYLGWPGRGVFKSMNGGSTWSLMNSGLVNTTINSVAADAGTNVYVETTRGGEGFVIKLNPALTTLLYGTYLGGDGDDAVNGIAVDRACTAACTAWITGNTQALNFPVTTDRLQATRRGTQDGFIAQLGASGALLYASYLGGDEIDRGSAIALDAAGSVYVAGSTNSDNLPNVGSVGPTFGAGACPSGAQSLPCRDAFVAKLALVSPTAAPPPSSTPTATLTLTRTVSPTGTATATATQTATPGILTLTRTVTPTVTATATHTPVLGILTVTPTRTPTASPPPTVSLTPTVGLVSGHDFTLQSGSASGQAADIETRAALIRSLTWRPGTQTSTLVLRWSPEQGFAFPGMLGPGVGSYSDSDPLIDPTYCYLLIAYLGELSSPDVRALSDFICVYPATHTGASPPTHFRARLNETMRATLEWTAPGGQDHYVLTATRFDGNADRLLTVDGAARSFSEDIGNLTTCYRLVAFNGTTELGGTERLCTVPGIAVFLP